MNELQSFNFNGVHGVRVVPTDGEPMFVARDICDILELGDTSKAVERLSPSMKGTNTVRTPGGNQEMLTITEAGVYKLVFTSRKPEAERFTDWLAAEVLPAIRRTGTYSVQPMTELQILRVAIDQLEKTQQAALEAKQLAESTQEQFRELKDVIIHHDKDWRNWVNAQLQKVGFITGDYSTARTDSYKHLEERARCRLSVRLGNLRDRLRREGATPTMVNKTNYMDVIEVEPRLKEIYTTIVKELAIRYAS
jgi:prophage antirepressor-like protein